MRREAMSKSASPPETDDLKTIYTEICERDESIWDIRLRLLAALPLVSGTAVALLIRAGESGSPLLLIPWGAQTQSRGESVRYDEDRIDTPLRARDERSRRPIERGLDSVYVDDELVQSSKREVLRSIGYSAWEPEPDESATTRQSVTATWRASSLDRTDVRERARGDEESPSSN
jgi:hypothetical protein